MKQANALLLFLLFTTVSAFGKSIYIDYNASKDCMDSYEYSKDGNEETPYLFFHLKVSDNEKIILEAGEDYTPRQYQPSGTMSCQDLERDEQFVSDVNKGSLEVYIVQEHTYGFRVFKVKKAEYYYNTNIAFGSKADGYSFAYYYNQLSTGNLATKDSKGDVYFSEKDDKDCLTRYKFRITTDPVFKNSADLTVLPEIGVLYKKSDPVPPLAVGQKLELKKINDYNIVDYLGLICKFYGGKPNTDGGSGIADGSDNESGNGTNDPNDDRYDPTASTTDSGSGIQLTPEGEIKVIGPNRPSGSIPTGNVTYEGSGRVYLDLDKGYYRDFHTGERAEGEYGGNFYENGYMVNANKNTVTNPVDDNTMADNSGTPAVLTSNSDCLEVSTEDTHIVQKKENLFSISRLYGLTIKEIKAWNGIGADNRIYPCMRLSLKAPTQKPAKGNTSNCDEQPTYNTHIVQRSESLFSIAQTYGVTVNQIKAWNGLRRNIIYPCTRLLIQPPTDYQVYNQPTGYMYQQPVPMATVTPASQPTSYAYVGAKGAQYHTVAKSETLYRIGILYGMKVEELKRLNNLTSNTIKPGQVLLIAPAIQGTRVDQPTATPTEYMYVNPALGSPQTTAGQARQNAGGQAVVTGKGGELIEYNVQGQRRLVYVVQDEDTLFSIARKFNTSVAKLRALNDMDRNEVVIPFQRLYVE